MKRISYNRELAWQNHRAESRPLTGLSRVLRRRRAAVRSAFTLRELTVAIAMGSTIMFAAMSSVHHAMNWASVSQQRRHENLAYTRLVDQLRHDVHRSATATVSNDGKTLNLGADRSIRYEITDSVIRRLETAGLSESSSDVAGKQRREVYVFRADCRPLFLPVSSTGQVQLEVRLLFDEEEKLVQLDREPPLVYSMRASLGLQQKYEEDDLQ